jgi:predicted dehydrogenase
MLNNMLEYFGYMKTVKVGVIGLGNFGELEVNTFRGIVGVEVVAVNSRRIERAKEVARKYNVRKYYTDFKRLIDDEEIEAVCVATGDDEHLEPTIYAAEKGKHVLVEKPIAANLKDADMMISKAKSAGIILMVGHILRFDARYAKLKEMIEEGRLGNIISIYARRNAKISIARKRLRRVPPVVGAGIHDIDIALWITEKEVKGIYAQCADTLGLKFPNIMWTVLRLGDNCIATFENCYALPDNSPIGIDARMEIIGDKGTSYIDTYDQGFSVCTEESFNFLDVGYWPEYHGYVKGALKEELEYFVNCVRKGEEPKIVTPEDARRALEIALKAYEVAKNWVANNEVS